MTIITLTQWSTGHSCHSHPHKLLPAFLSFLFLNTDTMTSRFPITSTTMVVIRTPANTVTTQGKEWCCWPEAPSSPLGVALWGPSVPSTMVGSWSSRDISCGRCLGSTSCMRSWSWRVGPFSITHSEVSEGAGGDPVYKLRALQVIDPKSQDQLCPRVCNRDLSLVRF